MKARAADLLLLLSGLLLGGCLRVYRLPTQILLGDEWHALNYVINLPYGWLMTHLGGCATSPPMNLYTRFLLDHFGWSEFGLRLPMVASGLAGLVLLPWLVLKLFGRKVAFVFSLLMAISPVWVLYDRNARPYAAVVLFGGICVLSFWEWLRDGRRLRWAMLSTISGALAIWLHLFAAIAVLVPICWGMVWSLCSKYWCRPEVMPGRKDPDISNFPSQGQVTNRANCVSALKIGALAIVTSVLAAILVLPAVINSLGIKMRVHSGKDVSTWNR